MTIIVKNEVDFAEESFYDQVLLKTEYMQRYREEYYYYREKGFYLNPYRNYLSIINYFSEINEYREQHAASFAKRVKAQQKNWRECESVVSEVIVYQSYLRPMNEGLVRSISFETDECDVIVERCDGSKYYLEVFCIMPDFPTDGLIDIRTHTQEAFSSVRQKLLNKVRKQGQFSKDRENFAVIELNNRSIAHDFTILSSLSDGYKINIELQTMKSVSEGYDWNKSVFELPETKFLKGIIWFHLGAYQYRKTLLNAYYKKQ
ncbi:MAG: hypothetical protein KME42_03830 [Tildeniella nuda ZEHNDER 1965/U140]|jgi:hypothetical protein|nr:hypothetical protein [Tildeniella nuda ZEHNDER 1965/U140]